MEYIGSYCQSIPAGRRRLSQLKKTYQLLFLKQFLWHEIIYGNILQAFI